MQFKFSLTTHSGLHGIDHMRCRPKKRASRFEGLGCAQDWQMLWEQTCRDKWQGCSTNGHTGHPVWMEPRRASACGLDRNNILLQQQLSWLTWGGRWRWRIAAGQTRRTAGQDAG